MTDKSPAPRHRAGKPDARTRIIESAYTCFGQFGIPKTSVEDIARVAGLSRQTLYKHFTGKRAIIDQIAIAESVKVNTELRQRLVRALPFADLLTEALLLITRIASDNPYVRHILDSREFELSRPDSDSDIYRLHRGWWQRLLNQAAAQADLATDITVDEIVTWITMVESMLLIYVEDKELDDPALRRLIRRFAVDPLMARPPRP